ncbi:hypothetical protein NET03_00405 [Thermomicrobium sp. CFH 73360]|uniref:hypothetical protein n=1 Tax=Thermomicrobium sp. CFH 73360 TaxID=2951987 RepID=UPI0020768F4D|nr:hypothetical protein [Thermomicrobium sp. CFH 73360]MCM8744984.1 hypothetical protein [Thermomicrobium sp. CFH 73360]
MDLPHQPFPTHGSKQGRQADRGSSVSRTPVPNKRTQPRSLAVIALALLFTILTPEAVLANGGQVRVANYPIGPYEVTVFTSPVPLQTGIVDVSVLLQRQEDKAIVENAEILLTITPLNGGSPQKYPVTREQATNKLYYAAEFPVDQPGRYRIELAIRAPGGAGSVAFDVTVERAEPTLWGSWWLWGAITITAIPLLWWLFGGPGQRPRITRAAQPTRGKR